MNWNKINPNDAIGFYVGACVYLHLIHALRVSIAIISIGFVLTVIMTSILKYCQNRRRYARDLNLFNESINQIVMCHLALVLASLLISYPQEPLFFIGGMLLAFSATARYVVICSAIDMGYV